jgi:hypothetical protein
MPLYLPEKITDFDIETNEHAIFVYFDTIKQDSVDKLTRTLRGMTNSVAITHRINMSDNGVFKSNKFLEDHSGQVSIQFKVIHTHLNNAHLVVFPVRYFYLVIDGMQKEVGEFYMKKFKELVKKNEI